VGDHLPGEKNGKRSGRKYGIAATAAGSLERMLLVLRRICQSPEFSILLGGYRNDFKD